MSTIRKFAAVLAFLLAGATTLIGLLFALGDGVDRTIEHSRKIEASFARANDYIESYRRQHARLPSAAEFGAWASSFPSAPYTPKGMRLVSGSFPAEARARFGAPTDDAYLLVYWRGEWNEYYASWAKKSSLEFDPAHYYLLGSGYADGAAIAIIAMLLLLSAVKLWPKQSIPRPDRTSDLPSR